jgi:predicted flavoprotein YhiN
LDESEAITAGAVVLALGGASWPETGSDGNWPRLLIPHGVELTPFVAANCGWNVVWPSAVLERAEGLPLKNLNVRAADETVFRRTVNHPRRSGRRRNLSTRTRLAQMAKPELRIDFKPQVTAETLRARAAALREAEWLRAWKLSPGAIALLQSYFPKIARTWRPQLSGSKTSP